MFFDAVKRDAGVRGRYLQRYYAQMAMQEHVASPDKYKEAAAAADPEAALARQALRGRLQPIHFVLASFVAVVAIMAGMLAYSPSYELNMRYILGLPGAPKWPIADTRR